MSWRACSSSRRLSSRASWTDFLAAANSAQGFRLVKLRTMRDELRVNRVRPRRFAAFGRSGWASRCRGFLLPSPPCLKWRARIAEATSASKSSKKNFLGHAHSQTAGRPAERPHIIVDRSLDAGLVRGVVACDGGENHGHVCDRARRSAQHDREKLKAETRPGR